MADKTNKALNSSNSTIVALNCPVCLQAFNFNGGIHSICTLPCGHIFGKSCLMEWFRAGDSEGICPVCRTSVTDMKNKLSKSDSYNDLVIELHGCTDNGLIEASIQSRKEIAKEHMDKIKEINDENTILKLKMQEQRDVSRCLLFGIFLSSRNHRHIFVDPSSNDPGNSISNLTNISDDDDMPEAIIKRGAEYLRRFNYNSPFTVTSNEIISFSKKYICPNDIRFKATQIYSWDFEEVMDASCSNDINVVAVKKSVNSNQINKYGVVILNGRTPGIYIPLSNNRLVAVKIGVDPSLTTTSKMVVVCEKGKFYEIIYDKDTNSVVSYFSSLIDKVLNLKFFYKPSSLVWLSRDKYIVGTETGELFVKYFGINTFININYVKRKFNMNISLLTGAVKMLNKIDENTVICYQSKKLCIYNDKCGRVATKDVGDKVVSIHFNQHTKKMTVHDEVSDKRTSFELWEIFDDNTRDNNINNFDIECVYKETLKSSRRKSVEVPSISLNHHGNEIDLTFCTVQYNHSLTLFSFKYVCHEVCLIPVHLQLLIKVCLEEGKFNIDATEEIRFLVISKNNVKLFKLKLLPNYNVL
uniref:RING-type domain-containing protein n=1 Tax=Parastrongyloides trichosuri TaxID=131310 RepID=A0A0N5A0P2_PARTI